MSRIGKLPVSLPKGVEVKVDGIHVSVKGPKGSLERTIPSGVMVTVANGSAICSVEKPTRKAKEVWGLSRVLISNMVAGVSVGFKKTLEINGIGYKAELRGKDVILAAGFSHPFYIRAPKGIVLSLESPTRLVIEGIDKESVGEMAASVRKIRPPEPYKGKGLKYSTEFIKRKAGKTVGA